MEYNLKNFPLPDGHPLLHFSVEEWKKGFEKELRELYEDDINYISKKDVLKEILGE